MRFAVAALCVLALTGAAEARMLKVEEAADPCSQIPKGMRPITVWYTVSNLSQRELNKVCSALDEPGANNTYIACTWPVSEDQWAVAVLNTLTLEKTACAVQYETAHMPPNYWGDPSMESQRTTAWLKAHKKSASH